MESVFQSCVLEAERAGRTVLLSSHILAEVERLCDRVTIIRRGRAVEQGTLADLRQLTRTSIDVTTDRPADDLARLAGVHGLVIDGTRAVFSVDTPCLDATLQYLGRFGIRSLVSQPPTLEEMFLRHYGDDVAPSSGSDGEE